MKQQNAVQNREAEESVALMQKRILGQDPVGAAMAVTRDHAEERLKAERVQSRLRRMQVWRSVAEGMAITRVRKFDDPQVAASYVTFASLLARKAQQPLQVSLTGGNIILVLTGRSQGPVKDRGLNDEVLDLAEQLG